MPTDPKLESYLARLNKALGPISVSDRADIITEIKSHILDVQEKNPDQPLAKTLDSLGEPESVANRYLLERGLKPGKPARSPVIKWLTVGFLGTFTVACATLVILVWRFSPIISIDEENDRVSLLGGMIDVDGKAGTVKVGSTFIHEDEESNRFEGAKAIVEGQIQEIRVPFSNGKMEILPSVDNQIRWRCKVHGPEHPAEIQEDKTSFTLNLEKAHAAKCDLELPKKVRTVITGANGKLEIIRPQNDLDISLSNGKVTIAPDEKKQYNFDMKVTNGYVEKFVSSTGPESINIKVTLANGTIKRDKDVDIE